MVRGSVEPPGVINLLFFPTVTQSQRPGGRSMTRSPVQDVAIIKYGDFINRAGLTLVLLGEKLLDIQKMGLLFQVDGLKLLHLCVRAECEVCHKMKLFEQLQ